MRRAAAVVLLASALASCAANDVVGDAQAIIDGAPSAEGSVVAIGTLPPACGAPVGVFCTGTVVAPRLVLTAAHCFADAPPGLAYVIVEGADASAPGVQRHRIAEVTLHPAFDPTTNTADLAAVIVDPPFGATPMPLGRRPIDASIVGATATAIGYGAAEVGGTPTGIRTAGTLRVSALEGDDQLRLDPGPAMSCHGDSGGPIVLGGELLAVTAAGDPGCISYGIGVRVDAHLADFIDPALAAAASFRPTPPPIMADQVCSTPCTTSADCPAGLVCSPSATGSLCTVSGAGVGRLGTSCSGAMSCPGTDTCVQTFDGCHCLSACANTQPPPPAPGMSGGCSASRRPSSGGLGAPLIFCALALAMLKNRTRRLRKT